jgi:hypothetical protein
VSSTQNFNTKIIKEYRGTGTLFSYGGKTCFTLIEGDDGFFEKMRSILFHIAIAVYTRIG